MWWFSSGPGGKNLIINPICSVSWDIHNIFKWSHSRYNVLTSGLWWFYTVCDPQCVQLLWRLQRENISVVIWMWGPSLSLYSTNRCSAVTCICTTLQVISRFTSLHQYSISQFCVCNCLIDSCHTSFSSSSRWSLITTAACLSQEKSAMRLHSNLFSLADSSRHLW